MNLGMQSLSGVLRWGNCHLHDRRHRNVLPCPALVDPWRRADCLGIKKMVTMYCASVHPRRLPGFQRRGWRIAHPRSSLRLLSWVVPNDRGQFSDGGDVLSFVFGRGWHNLLERLEEVRGRDN